ncbi:MAG TPA: 3-dehydroquinate synthase [Rhodanobacteraceae bacterium]|nr:3-dehydroquinate synthase [Rhodanobacteraceae bacterium]
MTASLEVDVALGERRYPIRIGAGLLDDGEWRDALRGRHALVVTDEKVAPLYLARVRDTLGALRHEALVLPAGESAKTLDNTARVLDALATLGASRDAAVIALGGGVVGDLAGFAAATWMRGIDFVQLPTTLLAMVDSSVGGKTGVNIAAGKNLVGAFHQPRAVFIDTTTLATLPQREYAAGLAEVVKYGAIGDAAFFTWLEAHADALNAHDEDALAEAIAFSCRYKAGVVARDEREQGERALLNFGHTFGHALEAERGYGELLHGEAVAIGMVLAASLSSRLGRAPAEDTERLLQLLSRFGLPVELPRADPDALLARMRLDKKNVSGRLRLILWRGIGKAEIVPDIDEASVRGVLAAP